MTAYLVSVIGYLLVAAGGFQFVASCFSATNKPDGSADRKKEISDASAGFWAGVSGALLVTIASMPQ